MSDRPERPSASPATATLVLLDLVGPASIPVEHPARAVVHAAGVLDDALVDSLPATRAAADLPPRAAARDDLYELSWQEGYAEDPPVSVAVLGAPGPLAGLGSDGAEIDRYPDLAHLREAAIDGAPDVVALAAASLAPDEGDAGTAAEGLCARALTALQDVLACEPLAATRIVLVTERALATADGNVPDLAQAALVGLLRSARSDYPGRIALVDLDGSADSLGALAGALGSTEPVLALRAGAALAPRLRRAAASGSLDAPPRAGEVRVAMRAVGLNFGDVVVALDTSSVPQGVALGSEGAGVVVEVGAEVDDLAPGDRVMGLMRGACGSVARGDRRLLAKISDKWSFADAATVPSAFLTAYYALADLAKLRRGEKLLIHRAAGDVGMAALQLARHFGAKVYATAHPSEWETLRALGLPVERIASSRDADFKERFLDATRGCGIDVVLDSLSGELVDASLDLLPHGGRFIEMGKTDVRDEEEVARAHPGVFYRAFDLMRSAGPERVGEMLVTLTELFDAGVLRPLPVTAWDVREAPEAFRFMRESRHVGKIVLSFPRADRVGSFPPAPGASREVGRRPTADHRRGASMLTKT